MGIRRAISLQPCRCTNWLRMFSSVMPCNGSRGWETGPVMGSESPSLPNPCQDFLWAELEFIWLLTPNFYGVFSKSIFGYKSAPMSQIKFVKRPSSPRPSPPGEGETLPAFLEIPATGLTNDAIGYQRTWPKNPLQGERIQVRAGSLWTAQRRSLRNRSEEH